MAHLLSRGSGLTVCAGFMVYAALRQLSVWPRFLAVRGRKMTMASMITAGPVRSRGRHISAERGPGPSMVDARTAEVVSSSRQDSCI